MWKEDTRVEGTQFEIGQRAFKRNSEADWETVRAKAQAGNLEEIPADIYVRYIKLMLDIIAPSAQSLLTIQNALESKKQFMFFMDELVVENLEGLGLKQLNKLTLKIHDLSGGTATKVKKMVN